MSDYLKALGAVALTAGVCGTIHYAATGEPTELFLFAGVLCFVFVLSCVAKQDFEQK